LEGNPRQKPAATLIQDALVNTEVKIRTADSLPKENKADLLTCSRGPERRLSRVSQTRSSSAESVARFIDRSTREATRGGEESGVAFALARRTSGVLKGVEVSHPQRVAGFNGIGTTAANMPI
jgi:hypothetical protein